MSAFFVPGSSQFLRNTAPAFTGYPFTVGLWVRPNTTGAFRSIWMLGTDTAAVGYFAIYQWNTDVFNAQSDVGGTDADCLAGTVTSGSAVFLVARYISATNRRLGVLNANGSTSHAQNTTSQTPTVNTMHIGANVTPGDYFSGDIGEFWYTATDIQPDGAQLQDAMLRQLAYGGPFSVPHIDKDIIEYRSFRKHPTLGESGEVYFGAKGVQTWSNTNSVTITRHPPLPYWNREPEDVSRLLMV